ncbi:hypothetical protein BDF20DRAFT_818507 [Mycotypha africana]|uniref:uncharacterized protein n=1 Tax=Mycotypha africana TaxID=64632 RepID=UPI0023018562|nr:uncharacterized protein BDF20DRAFT_818507 [Mycotypha africana]KAI8981818.1 hypothetical protein BDF20DRAFT_818507 [Mycotypha africana]
MLELPSIKRVKSFLKNYTSEPHLAGTETDKKQAIWTREKWNEFGIPDTKIETYYPLLNYPISRRLAIVSGPEYLRYNATMEEAIVDEDNDTINPNIVPLFHGYSKNGTAKGPVIYANYGRLEDFQFLVDQGVQVEGTIALVRYGGTLRGLKVRAAEQYGCVGVLIYSDPIDDGPIDKDSTLNPPESYPEGPWRSARSAQRGSVEYLPLNVGDPLTPGIPALENATRIPMEESNALPKIPSLPLSWHDALPLLRATQDHGVFGEFDWRGGLENVDYFSGPSEGLVEMENIVAYNVTPIWNVIGRIEGSMEPHRAIILGNHRDAWVYGAVDPSSGSAVLMEIARVLGQMLQIGWRPKRTIILASWDAEEYGLIGSTEWVEDHKEWLEQEGAVYVNCDAGISGPYFKAGASPSLNQLLYEVTSMVMDPSTGKSVYEAWGEHTNKTGIPSPRPFVDILGSGSDFTAFLDHLGIASIDIGFEGDYGVYHSIYDDFHWMEKFGDPDFTYHQAMVKIWGLLALRLADDLILPLHPSDYAVELTKYVHQLYIHSAPHTYPTLKKSVNALVKAASSFEESWVQIQQKLTRFNGEDSPQIPAKWSKRIEKMNDRLTAFEKGLIDPQGIKGREWFKHVVYAPGLWTGYAGQTFPAVAEAFDAKDMHLTRHAENRAAKAIQKAQAALL